MKTDTWSGYTESGIDDPNGSAAGTITVDNDDVFTIQIKQVPWSGSTVFKTNVSMTEKKLSDGSFYTRTTSKSHRKDDSSSKLDGNYSFPDAQRLAALLAYRLSGGFIGSTPQNTNAAGERMVQCTSLDTQSWADDDGEIDMNGLTTIIGRHVNKARGEIVSISGFNQDSGTGSTIVVCFRTVDSVEDLPPNSFEDHTLKVVSAKASEAAGFYMRFVSDDVEITPYANNDLGSGYSAGTDRAQFDSTSKLPRKGHWEEYCGTGVKQTLDSSTMPHLFVERADGTYAFMEARGSFVVNSAAKGVTFANTGDTFTIDNFDGGWHGTPLVVGDTVTFSTAASTLPSQITEGDTYTIASKTYAGAWKYTLTDAAGAAVVFTGDTDTTDCEVTLTTYKNFDWAKRVAGDDTSNPVPSFVGNRITAMSNFQNRLVFASENEVTFSGTGDYFNVFRTTVRDLLDSDPFTLAPNTEHGDIVKYAVPFDRKLVIISNKAQFAVSAESGFGPTTASLSRISQTASDFYGMPIVVGDNIFLSYSTEDGSGVFNLRQSTSVSNKFDTDDISMDIPGYLPLSPRRMVGSEKHNTLVFLDDAAATNNDLYVYTWQDTPKGRVHSAWTKWTLGSDYTVIDMVMVVDRLYLLCSESDSGGMLTLEYIDLDMTTEDSLLSSTLKTNFDRALIDRKTHNTAATADTSGTHGGVFSEAESSGDTTIYLKWKLTGNNKANVVIVKADGTVYTYDTGGAADGTITVTPAASNTLGHGTTSSSTMTKLVLNGVDLTSADYYVGLAYTMTSTYGPFLPATKEQSLGGRNIFIRGGRLTYSMANEFKFSIVQPAKTFTQTVTTSSTTATRSGDVKFAIRKDLPNMAWTITNSKPWNAMFQVLHYDMTIQEIS
tara:strand:- start:346 stop:3009 length:2664 start_codon:yes stop_codon:yes gene_type:complete